MNLTFVYTVFFGGTRFALIKMGEQSRGEKQSERGEIILEELRQVLTKGYVRAELKKRIKYICMVMEEWGS